ncbi:ribosomal protein S7 [Trichinella spiralis]|nr:ribosomal protein S7 [Trichinella spiralis]
MVMKDGRKDLAQRIMANCFEYIKRKQVKKWLACNSDEERKEIECNPWKIFHKAIENCTPVLKLMPATRGGITYQGRIVKKKQDLHRQCEANKAYAHYRWK